MSATSKSPRCHPDLICVPPMSDLQYEGLKADMATRGLQEPIPTLNGVPIGGRARLRACRELGIAPQFREWDGEGSVLDFITAADGARRHASPSQLATFAVLLLERMPEISEGANERRTANLRQGKNRISSEMARSSKIGGSEESAERVGRIIGVSRSYVCDARALRKEHPDLFDQVHSGELSLTDAVSRSKRGHFITPEEREESAGRNYEPIELGDVLRDADEATQSKALMAHAEYLEGKISREELVERGQELLAAATHLDEPEQASALSKHAMADNGRGKKGITFSSANSQDASNARTPLARLIEELEGLDIRAARADARAIRRTPQACHEARGRLHDAIERLLDLLGELDDQGSRQQRPSPRREARFDDSDSQLTSYQD